MLMRNSHRDGRKNGKLEKRYLGPYKIAECLGKGVYKLCSVKTGKKKEYLRVNWILLILISLGKLLKNVVNGFRLYQIYKLKN